jgi:hypothetical protein
LLSGARRGADNAAFGSLAPERNYGPRQCGACNNSGYRSSSGNTGVAAHFALSALCVGLATSTNQQRKAPIRLLYKSAYRIISGGFATAARAIAPALSKTFGGGCAGALGDAACALSAPSPR